MLQKLTRIKSLPLKERVKELKRILNETQDSELKKRILKELEDAQLEEELQEWKGRETRVNLKDLVDVDEEESLDEAVRMEQKNEELKYKEEEEKLGKDLYKPGSHKDEEESLYKHKEKADVEEKDKYVSETKFSTKEDEEGKKKRRW